ncbi:MAG: hypothetical protein GXP42_10960 [Chloroflexi bacterium]|nr:hypothetical protein [Chloroflexota bacterium]
MRHRDSRLQRIFLVLVLVLALAACVDSSPAADATPTTQTAFEPPARAAPQELWVLPDDGVEPLISLIGSAQRSIRFKVYLLTREDIRAALVRAANRGVNVRVFIEREPIGGGASNRESYEKLRENGVDVRWASGRFRLMHEKTLVVDDETALVATFNNTNAAFTQNREYGLLVRSPLLVTDVIHVFDADWTQSPYQPREGGAVVLSPDNSRARIESLIAEAQSTLWLEQASLLDDAVTDLLVDAAKRGVDVVFIGPLRSGEEDYSWPNYQRLLESGARVARLGAPQVHAKVILVDERIALIGSINLTYSSLELNRELAVLTTDSGVLARLRATLASDMAQAQPLQAGGPARERLVSWRDAPNYMGREVTVEGAVVRTYNSGKVVYLNFDEDYRTTLSIVIFRDDWDKFPQPPETHYRDQVIRVKGLVKEYKGRPEIVVSSPEQIEVVAAALPSRPEATPRQSAEPPVISWRDASEFVGQQVVVEGKIVRTYDSGKVTFLNFTEDWRGTLSIVIFASDIDKFPQSPASYYRDRFIRVRGRIKEYKGAPEIIVESPAQIEIMSGSADDDALATRPPPSTPTGVVPWLDAGQYVGQTITVEGRVVQTHDAGSITFLNFSRQRGQFVAVVFAEDYERFPKPPAEMYEGQRLWITGLVSEYRGIPQIVVRSPEQIEIFP